MHHLLDLVAPAGCSSTLQLHSLSFGAAGELPRSDWEPPQHTLLADDREAAGDQADIEQAWAPTVRMEL